ncbi:MAG TPA: hypothetical protein VF423_13585 [Actinomycetes bacterium]|jgi:hypothetical protein
MHTPVTRAAPPTGVRRWISVTRRQGEDLPHRRPRTSLPPLA